MKRGFGCCWRRRKLVWKRWKKKPKNWKHFSYSRSQFVKIFKLNSWQEAGNKFSTSVHPERLFWFKNERLSRQTQTTYADINNCIVGPDGVTRERSCCLYQTAWARIQTKILHGLKVVPSCQLPILDILLKLADDRGGGVFCCVSLGRFLPHVGQEIMCQELYHQCYWGHERWFVLAKRTLWVSDWNIFERSGPYHWYWQCKW